MSIASVSRGSSRLGNVDADFTLSTVDASASIAYNLSEVAATFLPQSGSTRGSFNEGASAVTVSAGPNITEAGSALHCITIAFIKTVFNKQLLLGWCTRPLELRRR